MSAGKQVTAEVAEIVIKLKKHYDQERSSERYVSTKDPATRTAVSLGLGVATVKRIMARSGRGELVLPAQRPGRPPSYGTECVQSKVREFVRTENLKGAKISLKCLRIHLREQYHVDIPKTTLWRALGRWGFTYGQGRRRDSLKEQDYVIRARREYLRLKLANRNSDGSLKRPEIYLDETYINRNHSVEQTWYESINGPWVNKPSGVGPRLIIVNAISHNGWVSDAELVFDSKRRTGDYHGQMNWMNFSKWFNEQLIPNIPKESIVILDNARYHNVLIKNFFPSACSKKEQLQNWLNSNGHPWHENMLKSELLAFCKRFAPDPEYRLDSIASDAGVSILRTPPYHPELQPIEKCWAVVKNYMAEHCDFTMKGMRERLPDAFGKVTKNTCRKIIAKVTDVENKYWDEDEKLDEIYMADACEELEFSIGTEGEASDPYLKNFD